MSEINNTQVDNAKDTDIVMPMENVIKYSDNYLKTSESLLQYYRDEPFLNLADAVVDFSDVNHNSKSFKYKQKVTCVAGAKDTKKVELMVALKCRSNFWTNLETPLINCEFNLIPTWSKKCVIASNTAANQATTFAITDTNLYVPVVALSTQDNAKLLKQLKSGFKRKNN